ncbi:ThuA domain-containing protein [Candidatus Latescibacterota bacterium]
MNNHGKTSRRSMLKTGMSTLAAASVITPEAFAEYKTPGEVRVIFLGGDFYHNGVTQEQTFRRVYGVTDWRLMFAQDPMFMTPELLEKADLFVMTRYMTDTQKTNFSLGFSPDRIVENRANPSYFMIDELENSIIKNVERGMGLLSLHCSIWNGNKRRYMDLLGVEKPIMHTKVQPTLVHDLNQNHPITKGIADFSLGDDEIFSAVMKDNAKYTPLLKLKGDEQPVDILGGWCRDVGKGRVVSLLPGHTTGPYVQQSYRKILWNAAHWSMKSDIPDSPHIKKSFDTSNYG